MKIDFISMGVGIVFAYLVNGTIKSWRLSTIPKIKSKIDEIKTKNKPEPGANDVVVEEIK